MAEYALAISVRGPGPAGPRRRASFGSTPGEALRHSEARQTARRCDRGSKARRPSGERRRLRQARQRLVHLVARELRVIELSSQIRVVRGEIEVPVAA